MPDTQTVRALGRGTGVVFSIDDSAPFDVAQRRLREYLSHCRGLYSSGAVSVNVGRRILAPDQLAAIKRILDQETGLTVTGYWCPPEVLSSAAADAGGLAEPSASGGFVEGSHDGEADVESAPSLRPKLHLRRTAADTPSHHPELAEPCAFRLGRRLAEPSVHPESAAADSGCSEPEGRQLLMLFSDLEEASAQGGPATDQSLGETQRPQRLCGDLDPDGKNDEAVPEIPLTRPRQSTGDEVTNIAEGPADVTQLESAVREPLLAEAAPSAFSGLPNRGSEALIIKNTCRSGEVIRYPGDVVVFGDVNPGAEIVAAGDIVVLGALRGMAHAGADGNLKATILALNLESHRLQIGSCVGERPRGARKGRGGAKAVVPQIAYLRRRSIFVAPFERRCEDYQGGVPYEG